MARRRKKKNSNVFAYAFSLIFIVVVIVFWLNYVENLKPSDFYKKWNQSSVKTWTTVKVYANSTISWNGLIKQIPYNMQVSTSYEMIYSWKTFFAKSDNYLLWNYAWQNIDFSGVVVGFSPDNIPVLNINYIKSNKEIKPTESKTNKYLNKDGLIVNLENIADNLQVSSTWNEIQIYKLLTWNNLSWDLMSGTKDIYVTIKVFKCNPDSTIADCSSLRKQYKLLKFNTLTNDNWVVFYKLPETNQYEVFWDEYGYYFKPEKSNLYYLINAFSLIDTQKIKEDLIKNTCNNQNISMQNILDINSTGDVYTVIWVDTNSNKIICKLKITNNWTYVWKLLNLDYLRGDAMNNSAWSLSWNDYLVYSSRAYWYKVYMPKNVKYESDLVNEDFWISGLSCKQVVNIAPRKWWNLPDPDVKVYYCESQISKYLIEDGLSTSYKNFKVINNWNKFFVIIYKDNSSAKEILNYIKLY